MPSDGKLPASLPFRAQICDGRIGDMDSTQSVNNLPASHGSTSSSLLERVKARNPEAWQRLASLYGPTLLLWCRQAGIPADDAADVVQETFLDVARGVADFRRQRPKDSFRGWLWTITRNNILDHFRRIQGSAQAQGGTAAQEALAQVPDSLSDASQPPGPLTGFLEQRFIAAIRAEFEDRTWSAFWQSAVEGREAADIAAELGMSKRAVRQAKYRVLCRLRQELDGLLD